MNFKFDQPAHAFEGVRGPKMDEELPVTFPPHVEGLSVAEDRILQDERGKNARAEFAGRSDTWTITCRNKLGERLYFAWSLLFGWPQSPTSEHQS